MDRCEGRCDGVLVMKGGMMVKHVVGFLVVFGGFLSEFWLLLVRKVRCTRVPGI